MTECSCSTFTIEGDSYTVHLNQPLWNNVDGYLTNNTIDFDFYDGDFDVINTGLEEEPLVIRGMEFMCGNNVGLCMPLCIPFCFMGPIGTKFDNIDGMMNEHEEITITGLVDCQDGIYIIQNFRYGTVKGSAEALWWELHLQYVRES